MVKRYLRLVLVALLCVIICGCIAKPQDKALYPIEAYFSPNGHADDRIIKAIDSSTSSIDLGAKQRGIKIRIAADSRQAKGAHSVIQALINEGPETIKKYQQNFNIIWNG